jgi:hypothetical protein
MLYKNIPNADKLEELVKDLGHPFLVATSYGFFKWAHVNSYLNIIYTYHNRVIPYNEAPYQLDTTPFQNIKPEVYNRGDMVEVLEVAREVANYEDWDDEKKEMIGKQFCIERAYTDLGGVCYGLGDYYLPHFAVRKVVDFAELEKPKPEPEKKTVTLELTDEQLEKIKEVLKN